MHEYMKDQGGSLALAKLSSDPDACEAPMGEQEFQFVCEWQSDCVWASESGTTNGILWHLLVAALQL